VRVQVLALVWRNIAPPSARLAEALAFVHAVEATGAELRNATAERVEAYLDARINPTGSVRAPTPLRRARRCRRASKRAVVAYAVAYALSAFVRASCCPPVARMVN